MIDALDETLRQLLIREIPIKNGEVDIAFDQPKREWSARLNRPTLNLFLFDLHENKKLRQTQPMWTIERQPNGTATKRRKETRYDLYYLVTAWATEPDDEHRLLSRSLLALMRQPHLPEELMPEALRHQPLPVPFMVAQEEHLRNQADLWGAIDNEWRPGIPLVITISLDPYQPVTAPLVRTRELGIGPVADPTTERLTEASQPDRFWTIGGTVHAEDGLDEIEVKLLEKGQIVSLQPEGRFAIGNLKAGDYTLQVSVKGRKPRQHKITVPAADYDIKV
jgi:hypothetical protein